MSGKSWREWVRFLVGGLGALVLGTAFAPGAARAACGDNLIPLHDSPAGLRPGPLAELPPRPPPPCSGPSCSRVPLAPPAAPASTPVRGVDDPGALPPPPPCISPSPTSRMGDDARRAPVRRPADVYHPPR